jgi:ethanolamine ammonia-lyase small subunit
MTFTRYPNPQAVIEDVRRIAAKTGQAKIADELIDDILGGRVVAVGFGYFGERGTLVYQASADLLTIHAVYCHDLGLDEANNLAIEIARELGLSRLTCSTVRAGLAFKLLKRGWRAQLYKQI